MVLDFSLFKIAIERTPLDEIEAQNCTIKSFMPYGREVGSMGKRGKDIKMSILAVIKTARGTQGLLLKDGEHGQ